MTAEAIRIELDDARIRWAFSRAPGVVERHVEAGLDWAASVVAADARRKAPTLFSTLKESINAVREESLQRVVRSDAKSNTKSGVKYARYVEEGTGPAAGHARYYPNPDALLEVLRASPSSRGYKWAKKGSRKRGGQDVELWLRSRAWAMAIYARGTRPHPFMRPALEENRDRCAELVRREALNGVREVFGSGM